MTPAHIEPGPGQESVWDYPRPPRIEACSKTIVVRFNGQVVAETQWAKRVLETSHPPVYYIPPDDVRTDCLRQSDRTTLCEWKGRAAYWDVTVDGLTAPNAAWSYPEPTPAFEAIRDHLAFYPGPMDSCTVDGVEVEAQPGRFYGGWITPDIVGPFKG
jgi:uncharacterized protein (DUF427 family)